MGVEFLGVGYCFRADVVLSSTCQYDGKAGLGWLELTGLGQGRGL